jgi:uncharacterized small protein (DUF1192 family)
MATMRAMGTRIKGRGKDVARTVSKVRANLQTDEVAELRARIAVLEDEVQECRQLNLRLAELTDVVQELLLPVAQQDQERIAQAMERYSKGL